MAGEQWRTRCSVFVTDEHARAFERGVSESGWVLKRKISGKACLWLQCKALCHQSAWLRAVADGNASH
jgi:hypothetical protein